LYLLFYVLFFMLTRKTGRKKKMPTELTTETMVVPWVAERAAGVSKGGRANG
jgi:hypothetical protein